MCVYVVYVYVCMCASVSTDVGAFDALRMQGVILDHLLPYSSNKRLSQSNSELIDRVSLASGLVTLCLHPPR